jgi:hypothetical protein
VSGTGALYAAVQWLVLVLCVQQFSGWYWCFVCSGSVSGTGALYAAVQWLVLVLCMQQFSVWYWCFVCSSSVAGTGALYAAVPCIRFLIQRPIIQTPVDFVSPSMHTHV